MRKNYQIKDKDQFIVVLKKLFCMNVKKKSNLLIRDLLMIFKFRKIEIWYLVNFYNLMICNGLHGTGSKLKLV